MSIHQNRPHEPDGKETPPAVFFSRRRWLIAVGVGAGAAVAAGLGWKYATPGSKEEVFGRGAIADEVKQKYAAHYPSRRNESFTYGRPETERLEAARYCNFYEFSRHKWVWEHVEPFNPHPWTVSVSGLCRKPLTIDLASLHKRYADLLEERQYRHRCVEKWAMAVPWTGFPLAKLLLDADPLPTATHVRFVSFNRPDEASRQRQDDYPWPYSEGLTIAEAMSDLTLLTVGVYGQPLLKQHGAPVRIVTPWKYGYKSIKSIQRIELVAAQPATFWNTLNPSAYPFGSNVNPMHVVPWRQDSEHMLGSGDDYPTEYLNGYRDEVGHLYDA